MRFSKEKPPNWSSLSKRFNVEWGGSLVVAYGDTIYHTNDLGLDVYDQSLILHESVHLERQKKNPDEWWSKYLNDAKFRLGEELLAYRAQYQMLKRHIKDRNVLFRALWKLANDLSSIYDLPVNQAEAVKLIKLE